MVWGAIISAAGQIGSALLSRGGGSNLGDYWQRGLMDLNLQTQGFKNRINAAREMGIHPLVALGSPTYSPAGQPISKYDPRSGS